MDVITQIKNSVMVPNRCYQTAEKSKEVFERIASKYLILKQSNIQDDIDNHIDYYCIDHYCEANDKPFTVDIKSAKKFFDEPITDLTKEWIWVELKNVHGNHGWLYGKATHIVYVFNDSLWFINRIKLAVFIARKVIPTLVKHKDDSKYHYYQRKGRKDIVTQVLLGDILSELKPIIFT